MRILGLTITRQQKTAVAPLSSNYDAGWKVISEPFAGAWQKNISKKPQDVLTHSAVYACITLIASDIGKLRIMLTQRDADGVWLETENAAYSPVLRKPNRYQTRQKFLEQWIVSKLIHGNTYVLKERDARGVVTSLYILDPCRVRPLVADDGSVFYQLSSDNLAGLEDSSITVPASEIIHDIAVALWHPLCGVSPIMACALPAAHGLQIAEHSVRFFANGANPGGVLTAPAHIPDETANRLKKHWEERFTGENVGRVAVLGDGLKYEAMGVNATDSQLIEQLKWSAQTVCSVFHVPTYMVGVDPPPSYNNIESLNTQYYAQCLQTHIEAIEACLDEGLALANNLGTELDLDGLLRMDTAARVKAAVDGIGGGLFKPDEGRKRFNLPKVKGGDAVYLQQQNYSLAALDERDRNSPFDKPAAPAALPAPKPANDPAPEDVTQQMIAALNTKFASEALLCST